MTPFPQRYRHGFDHWSYRGAHDALAHSDGHHFKLTAGSHLIAIMAPDYQPLIIDVIVSPGHTTTYRGALTRAPAR
jgi:hypothetical protein